MVILVIFYGESLVLAYKIKVKIISQFFVMCMSLLFVLYIVIGLVIFIDIIFSHFELPIYRDTPSAIIRVLFMILSLIPSGVLYHNKYYHFVKNNLEK
jgi:hypothetical protein